MEIGERAPGFGLTSTGGETFALEVYCGAGRAVLFFVREFT